MCVCWYRGGEISFDELISSFQLVPVGTVPVEHDVDAIIGAEFVATVLEMIGLLPERKVEFQQQQQQQQQGSTQDVDDTALVAVTDQPPLQNSPAQTAGSPQSARGPLSPKVWYPKGDGDILSPSRRASSSSKLFRAASGVLKAQHALHLMNMQSRTRLELASAADQTGYSGKPSKVRGSQVAAADMGHTMAVIDQANAPLVYFQPMSFSSRHQPPVRLLAGQGELADDMLVRLSRLSDEQDGPSVWYRAYEAVRGVFGEDYSTHSAWKPRKL